MKHDEKRLTSLKSSTCIHRFPTVPLVFPYLLQADSSPKSLIFCLFISTFKHFAKLSSYSSAWYTQTWLSKQWVCLGSWSGLYETFLFVMGHMSRAYKFSFLFSQYPGTDSEPAAQTKGKQKPLFNTNIYISIIVSISTRHVLCGSKNYQLTGYWYHWHCLWLGILTKLLCHRQADKHRQINIYWLTSEQKDGQACKTHSFRQTDTYTDTYAARERHTHTATEYHKEIKTHWHTAINTDTRKHGQQ